MPGTFVDEWLQIEHQNTLYAGHTASETVLLPFKADITPTPATVYADLDADASYEQAWVYTDWGWSLPAEGVSKASLAHQFNFLSGDEGETYYGAALVATISGSPVLMYAERFTVPFLVPAGGASLVWQFNLYLRGACP